MSKTRTTALPKDLYQRAFVESVKKLDPRVMLKNPVMFVVEVGFFLTLLLTIFPDLFGGASDRLYNGVVSLILFVTILFANFAEALAEGRGKAQAESLKKRSRTRKREGLPKMAPFKSSAPRSCGRAIWCW